MSQSDPIWDHPYEPSGPHNPEKFTCTCGEHLSRHADKMAWLKANRFEMILKYGHEVIRVFPTEEEPGHVFAYSVGRSLFGKREILITGSLPFDTMGQLVNDAATLDDEGKLVVGQECDELLQGYPVRVVEVTDLDEAQMFQATAMTPNATAIQIVWPDKAGKFPGEADYEYPADMQPVFG